MGYWVKLFETGKTVSGTDKDVNAGLASWSQSRLDKMVGADLYHKDIHHDIHISVRGKGDYWQSDTLEAVFPFNLSRTVKRRIEKQINVEDAWFSIYQKDSTAVITFGTLSDTVHYTSPDIIKFCQKEDINKWLILEVDVCTYQIKYYISDNRI